jgi:hypothetical protein
MTKYVATINVPGYLPEDDDPAVFDTATEAWWYLYHERCNDDWQDVDLPTEGHDHRPSTLCPICSDVEDSETADELGRMAIQGQSGTVYGPTPGYDGDHDLGLAYSVTEVDE